MRFFGILLLTACVAAGCADDPDSPDDGNPNSGVPSGTEKITGTERIGWAQQAGSTEELATFRYLVYVDTNATDVQEVACGAVPTSAGYACSGKLPPMSAGQHQLSMSAYITSGGVRFESPRSATIVVVLVAQSTPASSSASSMSVTTTDGVQLRGSVVAEGLVDATDLAPAPDGRIFVAERLGRIRVFRDGRLQPSRTITLPDTTTKDGQGLLELAVDPDYARNQFVYAIYTTMTGFRLARLRAVGDTLGERAILMDGIPSDLSQPAAAMRFGPDGKLYVGFDDGGEPRRAGDLGSFNGKVLRLNRDASTPADQPGGSPVFAADINAPHALDWDRTGAALWVADGVSGGLLNVYAGQRMPVARYSLPDGSIAAALAVYRGDLIPEFRGNLLVAAKNGHELLRLRLDANDPTKVVSNEQLLGDRVERARAIAVGRDGAVYIAINTALLRLAP